MSFIIVDYSKGNLRSVQKGFELAGVKAPISAKAADLYQAEAIILPGVGSFADASKTMLENGQMQAIRELVSNGVPFFGICLGMQLLFERGDEGMQEGAWAEGLGILPGSCSRIASVDAEGRHYKIPHVGWNQVTLTAADHAKLFTGIPDGSHFYFTHSYQALPSNSHEVMAQTTHAERIASVVGRGKVLGVQFHPEKSSDKGLQLMKNFVRLVQD